MFQLVLSSSLPSHPFWRNRCLSDPDVLLDLAERAARPHTATEELANRFSLVLHDLRMAGAWKRTNRGRLRRTEEMLSAHIIPACRKDLHFLDFGASDGVTTLEAVRALRAAFGGPITAFAADLNLSLLRYRVGPIVEYRAANGEPVMARLGPIGIRLSQPRRSSNRSKSNLLQRLYTSCVWIRRAMQMDRIIPLINPLAQEEPGLRFLELSCLDKCDHFLDRFSAIRASNLLNIGYFSSEQIQQAVRHFHSYLRPGGCLVVSRNIDGPSGEVEAGSVWVKAPNCFRWVEDFGAGSEVKDRIDELRLG